MDLVGTAARIGAEKDARAKSIAAELLRAQEREREFSRRMDFDQAQQERAARQFTAKMEFDRERENADNKFKAGELLYKAGRDRVMDKRWDAENAPFMFSGESFPETKTESIPQNPDNAAIKLSNYGYASDTTPDSNSARGIGHANNKLEDGVSAAVSKSLATRLGIKTGDWLNIETTQGPMRVRYDDTVPASDSRIAGPLPETIDIFRRNGTNDWGGKVTGISVEKNVPSNLTAGQKVSNIASQLSEMNSAGAGIKNSDAAAILRSTIPSLLREPKGTAESLVFNDAGFAATKGGSVLQQMEDGRIVRTGALPQPEVMDIRNRSLDIASERNAPRAKASFRDESGKIYTQFTDGNWDNEPAVGVALTRLGEKPDKGDDKEKEIAALLREQAQWSREASSIDKALSSMGQPRMPISENGKYYKDVAGERESITKSEYDRLKSRADEISSEIASKKKQRDDFIVRSDDAQRRIDEIRGAKKPAEAPAQPQIPAETPKPAGAISVQDVISRGGKVKQDKAGVRYLFDESGKMIGTLK